MKSVQALAVLFGICLSGRAALEQDRISVWLEHLNRNTDAAVPFAPGGRFISDNSVLALCPGMSF